MVKIIISNNDDSNNNNNNYNGDNRWYISGNGNCKW